MSTILIRGARQLITLRGPCEPRRGNSLKEIHPIADGAVLISNGTVIQVGPTRRVENLAGARLAMEIDASGKVVMPGFVDSHTHLAFPGGPDDGDEAARRIRSSTGQRIEARARAYLEAMARHGTTTVEAKTGCGTDASAESKMLRVLSALRGDPLDLIPSFLCRLPQDSPEPAAGWIADELLPKVHKRKAAQFADIACPSDRRLLPACDRYLQAARTLGFARKIHAESADAGAAVDLAVRHRATSIDHLDLASEEDARRVGQAGLIATLIPGTCLRGGPRPPARTLIDSGAAPAIATNFNPHHSPGLNMQTAIAAAVFQLGMTVEEAISAATINGAFAVGEAGRIGSLVPGKAADIVVLNVSDYRDLPDAIGNNMVHLVIKNGEVIYREGEVSMRTERQALLSA